MTSIVVALVNIGPRESLPSLPVKCENVRKTVSRTFPPLGPISRSTSAAAFKEKGVGRKWVVSRGEVFGKSYPYCFPSSTGIGFFEPASETHSESGKLLAMLLWSLLCEALNFQTFPSWFGSCSVNVPSCQNKNLIQLYNVISRQSEPDIQLKTCQTLGLRILVIINFSSQSVPFPNSPPTVSL